MERENKMIVKSQKPMMLAYIIYLIFCVIYHIISDSFNFSFPMWERILVATTIASYAFSLGSLPRTMIKMEKTLIDFYNGDGEILRKIDLLEKEQGSASKLNIRENVHTELIDNIEGIIKSKKSIGKKEIYAFILDVCGYLIFFCIISFDGLFHFVEASQELYTMYAFIILMIVNYIETTLFVAFETKYKEFISNKNELIDLLEKELNKKEEK